jgi:hypothetical protein
VKLEWSALRGVMNRFGGASSRRYQPVAALVRGCQPRRMIETRADRLPNLVAALQSRTYKSSRRPRIFEPVSMTV